MLQPVYLPDLRMIPHERSDIAPHAARPAPPLATEAINSRTLPLSGPNPLARRRVILSPHPDDAVWSLGGAMAAWRELGEVLVVSVFDGDGLEASHDGASGERWRGDRMTAIRRREDREALESLGCALAGLGLPDAALRQDPTGAFACLTVEELFAEQPLRRWPRVSGELVARVQALLRPDDVVVAPLAVGRHVDHCIVHKLARHLDCDVDYYAEFPYASAPDAPEVASHLATLGLWTRPHAIPCQWAPWLHAASRYRSQVLRLFGGGAAFAQRLGVYAGANEGRPCSRIWSMRLR